MKFLADGVILYRIDFHSYFDIPRSPKKRISREGRIGFGKHKKKEIKRLGPKTDRSRSEKLNKGQKR